MSSILLIFSPLFSVFTKKYRNEFNTNVAMAEIYKYAKRYRSQVRGDCSTWALASLGREEPSLQQPCRQTPASSPTEQDCWGVHNCSTYVIDAYADAPTLCPLAGNFLEEEAGYSQLIFSPGIWLG